MQTDIYYRDITKTDNLEAYLMEKVEGAVGGLLKYDSSAHITVRVETDRGRSQTRRPSYMCEVIVKPTRAKQVIKVLKTGEDFGICVAKAVAAIKSQLVKVSDKKIHHRRQANLQSVPMIELENL